MTEVPSTPLSPKKSLKKERTRGSLSATSEHVSTLSLRQFKPLCVRRAASYTTGNVVAGGKLIVKGGASRRERLVSFHPQALVVCEIPTRAEMTPNDCAAHWFSKDDFKEIKKQYLHIVKKIAKKIPLEDGEDARGLEHKTPRGCRMRQESRYQAMDAVLDEQERQWEMQRTDPDYIAQIYRQSSAHCQLNAYLIAKKDAEFVAQEQQQQNVDATRRDSTVSIDGDNSKKGQTSMVEFDENLSFRLRSEQSPTIPVRTEPSKKSCFVSPQVILSSHVLYPQRLESFNTVPRDTLY